MNERIKEFIEQSGAEELGADLYGGEFIGAIRSDFLEKFAELIVKECVATLMEMHLWQSVNNQNYPATWHDAVDTGIETIKEHFGVEE